MFSSPVARHETLLKFQRHGRLLDPPDTEELVRSHLIALATRVIRECSLPWTAFSCLVLVGCGTADDGAALAAPERVVSTTGVETVTNLAPSLWVDTTGWRLRETTVIVPDDTGAGALTNPTGALLGADGLLYVAEREPRSVKVFSRDGRFVRSVGRTGEGPGEFRYVMLGLQGDTILVQDPSLGRLTRFDGAGNQVDITTSACCMMGPLLPVHVEW